MSTNGKPAGRLISTALTLVLVGAGASSLAIAPANASVAPAKTVASTPHHPGRLASNKRATIGAHYAKVVPACVTKSSAQATCFALRRIAAKKGTPGAHRYVVHSNYDVGPSNGYTPSDLWSAYGLGTAASLTAASGPGTGQTIGIVDAYDDPTIETDLGTFDDTYDLPACTTANGCFAKVNQSGSASPLPAAAGSTGWDGETSLDVEAAHAVCPDCKILLVEANGATGSDLATGVNAAVSLGATEVTNSYGAAEQTDATVQSAYNHPGVVITASSGDQGYYNWTKPALGAAANAPAAYPDVVAVGGTKLELNTDGTRASESVWNDQAIINQAGASGGGCSKLFAAQTWQSSTPGYSGANCGGDRLEVDVSAIGDPVTGFDTVDSYNRTSAEWEPVGGTSLSSPVIAAMYALAGGAQGVNYPSATLYGTLAGTSGAFYDVTSGGNGSCAGGAAAASCGSPPAATQDCNGTTACDAAIGYDGPSGVGTPTSARVLAPAIGSFTLPANGDPNVSVNADASASTSTDGTIASYSWNWGDGTTTTTASPQTSHTYTSGDAYTVTLTVTTSAGATSVAVSHPILVSGGPVPTNTTPPTVTGGAADQLVLSRFAGTWTHSPTSVSDTWERCNTAGASCTSLGTSATTYQLTDADVGHTIAVLETAANLNGPAASSVMSTPTAVIDAGPPTSTTSFTPTSQSPLTVGTSGNVHPASSAINPAGTLLAVANEGDIDPMYQKPINHNGSVAVYTIGSHGSLTPVTGSPFATGAGSATVAWRPDGKVLEVGNVDTPNTISMFSVADSGSLTQVTGSPFTGPAGQWTPDGKFIVSTDYQNLIVHAVSTAGVLSTVAGSPFSGGSTSFITAFAVSPDGSHVVSADYNKDTLTVWSLAADGTLAKLPGSPFALLDSLPLAVAFNDTGSLLAVALHNEMEILNFSPDGVATEDSIVAGSSEVQVAFSTDGDYLAATNGGPINVWSVSSQGAMKSLANMPLHPCTSSCELNVAWGANSDMLAVTSYLENALYVETASSGSPAGDTTPPTLTTTATPMWSGSSSVGLSYHGADNVAVASYDVRYERASATGAFGSFSYPASWQATTATRKTMTGVAGTTYCFEARSRDTSGNVSSWSKPGCTAVTLDDRALKASTGWSSITGSGYFDKTARTTKHKSATLTKAGVQTKRITLVASTCSTCGSVRVYLGSALLKTINLYSSRSKNQVRFTVSTFSAVKSGSVVIKTVNTKRVTVDGLGLSRV